MDAYSTRTVQVHEKERELARAWQRKHGRAPTSRELLHIANTATLQSRKGKDAASIDWDALARRWDATRNSGDRPAHAASRPSPSDPSSSRPPRCTEICRSPMGVAAWTPGHSTSLEGMPASLVCCACRGRWDRAEQLRLSQAARRQDRIGGIRGLGQGQRHTATESGPICAAGPGWQLGRSPAGPAREPLCCLDRAGEAAGARSRCTGRRAASLRTAPTPLPFWHARCTR
jgi:hypothetical protein